MLLKAMTYLDINNLFHIYKKLDFVKLNEWVSQEYCIVRNTAYNSIDHRNPSQLKFNVYLSNNNYKVVDPDISVETNCDNMIITDIGFDIVNFDHKVVIIVSCDGGYSYILNELSKRGYITHVIGAKEKTSSSLVNVCDRITYLEDIQGIIC